MRISSYLSLVIFFIVCCFSCKIDSNKKEASIAVRMTSEPDAYLPFLSKSSSALQIVEKIYLPMADFDPITLQMDPVLLIKYPDETNQPSYDLILKPDAVWSDGQPITAKDIDFTLKLIFNPYLELNSIKSTLVNIDSIYSLTSDLKSFRVKFKSTYHLDLEAFTNLPIMPAHVFDLKDQMEGLPIYSFLDGSVFKSKDSTTLKNFAETIIAKSKNGLNQVGSGAYKITQIVPGQKIELKHIDNWWGDKYKEDELLFAFPDQINYLILPDNTATISALISGHLDVASDLPAVAMKEMMSDEKIADQFTTGCPTQLQYYYVGMNNHQKILEDPKVRKALAHLVDRESVIEQYLGGEAKLINAPISPSKFYYNKSLNPVKFNPALSAKLLDESGWQISSDGIRSKVIDGKLVPLSLSLLTTGKPLGQAIANLLRDECGKLGITIKIETMEFPKIMERVKNGQYDLANLVVKQFPGLDDPFISWHSSNTDGLGANYSNVSSTKVDSIVSAIRTESDEQRRSQLYQAFQQEIYDLQPVIFLFSPTNCIVARKSLDPIFSEKRPGYFENMMH